MPYKKISSTVPFNAEDLYNMILDVEKYSEFVPYCKSATIDTTINSGMLVTMKIEIPAVITKFKAEYQSHVTYNDYNHTILIHNTQNGKLFKFMKSYWQIKPCIGGASIVYEISFELMNPILNLTLSSLFLSHSEQMVDAFKKRAYRILKPIA